MANPENPDSFVPKKRDLRVKSVSSQVFSNPRTRLEDSVLIPIRTVLKNIGVEPLADGRVPEGVVDFLCLPYNGRLKTNGAGDVWVPKDRSDPEVMREDYFFFNKQRGND